MRQSVNMNRSRGCEKIDAKIYASHIEHSTAEIFLVDYAPPKSHQNTLMHGGGESVSNAL